jgi:mono/diheme cytochrome c family protein
MTFIAKKKWLFIITLLTGAVLLFTFSTNSHQVDFNTQVKPIFNSKCISCHGGVKRQGGFSLLFRSEALANTESGKPAIIPGDPGNSELIRRITINDPEDRMPYKHPPLSDEEISVLRKWIKQGAQWGDHWAYVAVKPVEVPDVESDWIKNNIDRFIFDQLQSNKLKPSNEADKRVLLRRVSLDLIGMPAPDGIAKQFLNDNSANAYGKLVDTLLASPHFGEKWAGMWLDLARYADTKGYERDDIRSIWRYRDWLIKAFNEDKPYNSFLVEQIAGDLLPNATDAQYIATAFHRNTMTNDEGGTDNEEFRTAAVMDRVNTTWEALMGTTFACVQCHSHPYDPFRHEEYYKFLAFFNDSRDEDTYEDYPQLRHFNDSMQQQLSAMTAWIEKNAGKEKAAHWNRFVRTWEPSIHSLTADQFMNSELQDTKWLIFRNHGSARLKQVELTNKDQLIYRYQGIRPGGVIQIHIDKPDGPVLQTVAVDTSKSWRINSIGLKPVTGVHDIYITYTNPTLTNPDISGMRFDWLHFTESFPGKGQAGYDQQQKLFWLLMTAKVPATPVMMDNPSDMRRTTNVFERGNWLVKGKEVTPDVPKSLNPMPANAPKNRMGLAMWLTSKSNPLTARTMVNRMWEQLYGIGLAETLEDMGTQGIPPTHAALLDWLSWQFMNDYNWSVKKLLREMVLSATYRQDSKVTPALLEKDPNNKYYSRGMRVRLSAEQVRDQGLMISHLLSPTLYGPSVFPWQPDGIWMSPWNGQSWKMSDDNNRHRRAMYTYWKRTAPYPSMMTFDGAAREVCTPRRIRTNTPLQALVTLNDEVFLEMARHFAYRMQREGGNQVQQQISKGYELATYKPIAPATLQTLVKLYNEALPKFKASKDMTCEMVGVMDEHNNPETAALIVVANAMLNLDELITKN